MGVENAKNYLRPIKGSEMFEHTIITVGISPSWDIACFAADYQWGRHQVIERQTVTPAGKALNVSRALAELGRRSIAAGLWGQDDLPTALASLRDCPKIEPRFTAVPGQTRRNITLIDTRRRREMHLRSPNPLATPQNLRRLTRDLTAMAGPRTICVFSGAVPDDAVADFVRMVRACRAKGARIVVDTSGPALDAIVDAGGLWAIKPNVEELAGWQGKSIADRPEEIIRAARTLTDRVDLVLVSRGRRGAIAVTADYAIARAAVKIPAICHTVGCGDTLLAGFLDGFLSAGSADPAGAPGRAAVRKGLSQGVHLATKRAVGQGKVKP
jgi:1-phosphofructokinase family hexose kinase